MSAPCSASDPAQIFAPPPPPSPGEAAEWLFAQARACGFAGAALACAPVSEVPSHTLYAAWLAADLAGEMSYLSRDADARRDPRLLCAEARGVLSIAVSYHHPDPALPATTDGPGTLRGVIARYARAEDYHLVLKRRLAELATRLLERFGGQVAFRICVDTAPLLERALGERAGLGFIGKNTLLITPGLGSFTLLAELLVGLELAPRSTVRDSSGVFPETAAISDPPEAHAGSVPSKSKCGSCRLCLDVCPTGAFVGPHKLDARRCISYLTIENNGPIPRPLRSAIGTWIFGCDLCQEVCPWNASPTLSSRADPELRPRPMQSRPALLALLGMGQAQVRRFVRRTALRRLGRNQLLRNVAVALGNVGTPAEVPAMTAALGKEPPLVRQHLAWALSEIAARHPGAQAAIADILRDALTREDDPATQAELQDALSAQLASVQDRSDPTLGLQIPGQPQATSLAQE